MCQVQNRQEIIMNITQYYIYIFNPLFYSKFLVMQIKINFYQVFQSSLSVPVKNNLPAESYLIAPYNMINSQCHTDTPYRQDPNLGEDKGGQLGPKKDKYKICSLLNKAQPDFGSSAAFSCQFCQTLRYQNRSKGLVCHYIQI